MGRNNLAGISTTYISAAANRYASVAAVRNALIAFGSSTYVALWNIEDPADNGICLTLPGHEGSVTSVRFILDDLLVTADDKGIIKLWRHQHEKWTCVTSKMGHNAAISSLAVHGDLVVTGASDSTIKIWNRTSEGSQDDLVEQQSIRLKGRYPLCIDIARLPHSQALILAIGSTDRTVQIWTRSGESFVLSASLAGHEDWIKSVAFREASDADQLVLATGSQDSTIRLWNVEPYHKQSSIALETSNHAEDDLLDAFEASLGELGDAEEGGRQISLKRHMLTVKGDDEILQRYTVTFDALLVGHEAGVTSLSWRPAIPGEEAVLLSTSTDSSLILWSPSTITSSQDAQATLWINKQRFGDVGGQRLGGFVLGLWGRSGTEALACGWNGGWRRWGASQDNEDGHDDWTEVGAITGHRGPIKGLAWSPKGEYLISTGLDQTTRIHAPVPCEKTPGTSSWHEIGRPQVHGYDLMDAAFVGNVKFISIADEKVARVFEAPKEFAELVHNLHIADLGSDASNRPRTATVPPLGLSNKAVSDSNGFVYDTERMARRPFEGELAAITLWPEIDKVFGHGYESITLAVSTNKRLAATACKATTADHALVRIYDTETWQPVGLPLGGHSLTVTSVAFSPDDKYILSVSRDRSWRLYEYVNDEFVPVAADKSHARIIWDCSWSHEGDVFATASRDKTVKIWHIRNAKMSGKWTPEATIKVPEAATALHFAPQDDTQRRRLAIGLESGEIVIYSSNTSAPTDWSEDVKISSEYAHVGQIHRLSWRPVQEGVPEHLASCSEDGTLKVLGVQVTRV